MTGREPRGGFWEAGDVLFFFFFNTGDFFFFFKGTLFIYLFILAVLGLRFCARAFSSCGKRGPLLIAVPGPLTFAASPVAVHMLQTRRLSSCGSRAQLLHGMWDLPRPGLKPVSPALAGRFSTTVPPGKPDVLFFNLGANDTRGSVCENLSSYTFIIGVHLFVFILYFSKVFQNYQYHS